MLILASNDTNEQSLSDRPCRAVYAALRAAFDHVPRLCCEHGRVLGDSVEGLALRRSLPTMTIRRPAVNNNLTHHAHRVTERR